MRQTFLPICLALFLAAVVAGPASLADEGRNPEDDTSKSTIEDLFLGEYWFGAQVEDEDLHGKVVLFEIWGS